MKYFVVQQQCEGTCCGVSMA